MARAWGVTGGRAMKRMLLAATVIMASMGASSAEKDVVSPEQKRAIETIA
jgi:hypothetical protein